MPEHPIDWLLEKDEDLPSARYLALRDVLRRPVGDPELDAAAEAVMHSGPVPKILAAQEDEGYWVKPGAGYSPKYRATVWSILILAELGADSNDPHVQKGCGYLLDHSIASNAAFAYNRKPLPSGAVLCLNGNLLFALRQLGFGSDPRVMAATNWLAGVILGEEGAQFYASGTSGPGFACGINQAQPCGWGANKALRALLVIPRRDRTPLVERALATGAEFLLSRDPVEADYPYTERVSSTWFKLGFPMSYWSDVLETATNLVDLGYGADPRLEPALDWIESKADKHGRWKLTNGLNRKMWVDIENRGKASKMVTLRALRMLGKAGRIAPAE
jgi:hypothetical protein